MARSDGGVKFFKNLFGRFLTIHQEDRNTLIDKRFIAKIQVCLPKNVTAEVGEKYIYARIVKPDGDVLVKDRADVFPFEDREINYSCRKLIE